MQDYGDDGNNYSRFNYISSRHNDRNKIMDYVQKIIFVFKVKSIIVSGFWSLVISTSISKIVEKDSSNESKWIIPKLL